MVRGCVAAGAVSRRQEAAALWAGARCLRAASRTDDALELGADASVLQAAAGRHGHARHAIQRLARAEDVVAQRLWHVRRAGAAHGRLRRGGVARRARHDKGAAG
jgi:hypothetical protein